jgi:hypothetical protein
LTIQKSHRDLRGGRDVAWHYCLSIVSAPIAPIWTAREDVSALFESQTGITVPSTALELSFL